jgi:hypothetical protein
MLHSHLGTTMDDYHLFVVAYLTSKHHGKVLKTIILFALNLNSLEFPLSIINMCCIILIIGRDVI